MWAVAACLPRLAPSCSLLRRHHHPPIHRVLSAAEAGVPRPPCPERGPQLPPMEGLQEGSAHSSQVTSRRTQQLPLCPQGCASGSHWGLGLRSGHERTFPLFILHCIRLGQAVQHGAYGSSPEYPLPSLSSPALHIHLPAASSLASQQHSGASSTVGHQETVLVCLVFFQGGRKKSCCTQLGIQYHGRAPWAILAGMARQDTVTRGPGGWLCPPCPQ